MRVLIRNLSLIISAFLAAACQGGPVQLPVVTAPENSSATAVAEKTPQIDLTSFPAGAGEIFLTETVVGVPTAVDGNQTEVMGDLTVNGSANVLPDRSDAAAPCNQAGAGHPLDITIPDGTIVAPGQPFTKVWRLINRGNCTWTRDYRLIWFSGVQFGPQTAQPLAHEVKPGESIDISIELSAPAKAGVYQSNWKLSSADQNLFGIGPAGEAPFWVHVVVEGVQPTAQNILETDVVELENVGSVHLLVQESYDFDSGSKGNSGFDDIVVQVGSNERVNLEALQPAKLILYGLEPPSRADCARMENLTHIFTLSDLPDGMFFCLLTSNNFPGYVRLIQQQDIPRSIQLDYRIWLNP